MKVKETIMVTNKAIMKGEVTMSAEPCWGPEHQEAKFAQLGSRYSVSPDLGTSIRWQEEWWEELGLPTVSGKQTEQSACLCDEESHQGRDGWSQVLVWVWKRGQWTQASGPKSPLDIPESPTKIYKSSLSPGFITSMSKETQYSLAPVPSLCQKGTTDTPKEHSDEIAN